MPKQCLTIGQNYYYYALTVGDTGKDAKFYRNDPKYRLAQNIPRFGDIDLDGYPDLVFNVQYTENTSNISKSVILQNKACSVEMIDELKKKLPAFDGTKCRFFSGSDLTKAFDVVTKSTSYLTTFFDWGEMG